MQEPSNIEILKGYLETMPMAAVWQQVVWATHHDELDEDGTNTVAFILEKLKDKPDLVQELLQGVFYTLVKHSDDIRAQTEGVIQSVGVIDDTSN